MTDSPKPITPEFVRGARWAATLLANILDDPRRSPSSRFRTGVEWAHYRILGSMPEVSPLAAAKERLGAFLVDHLQSSSSRGEIGYAPFGWSCWIRFFDTDAMAQRTVTGGGATEAEAINAALDAAERSERP